MHQARRLRFVNAQGHNVPAGEPGELWVQGPSVMHGYLGQPEATAEALKTGFSIDARHLKKYLQQNIALFKIPREFRQIEKLPKTSTGKIAKKKLKAMFKGSTGE